MLKPRFLLLLACALLALATAPLAAQDPAAARVEADLRLERRLLALDLAGYHEARGKEQAAITRATEASARLDTALKGDTLTLGNLEQLYDQLAVAREGVRTATGRVDRQIERMEERMRRIAFLSAEPGGKRDTKDPLSGRWKVMVQPGNHNGTFELHLDVAVVTGRYERAGGATGSLRGTYVNNGLRLERIDTRGGTDATFLGTIDAPGHLTGTWQATDLASGQPTSGTWTAVWTDGGGGTQP
ncbi:MAG TPA: hypothetical protein VGE98_01165 [Thermoanaerobaculia bacterium]